MLIWHNSSTITEMDLEVDSKDEVMHTEYVQLP